MRKLVAVGAIVIFIYGMLAAMLGTIIAALAARLGLDGLEQSWLALAQGLGLAVTSTWAGALMDRRGRKQGILLGLGVSIIGLALLSHPANLPTALVAMTMLGIGGSLVIVGANTLVNDASEGHRASALNILNLFVGLGGMATPLIAGNLLHSDAMLVTWFAMAITAVALLTTLSAPIPHVAPPAATQIAEDGALFGKPLLYFLAAITFLYTACEFAMWNWLPKFLVSAGMELTSALNVLSLGFAGGMLVGRFIAATLLGRFAPERVILACAVSVAITSFITLHANDTALLAPLVFLTGLAMAPVFPTTIAIIGSRFMQRSGTAIGFAITCGFSGLVVSSPLIGLLADNTAGIGQALLIVPILALIIAAILLLLRRRLGQA